MTATIAKERPIIFTGHSVPAILDGRKTMTRRAIKPQPHECHNGDLMYKDRLVGSAVPERSWAHHTYEEAWEVCPYGKPGDRLWCRESFITGWPADSGYLRTFDGDGNEIPEQVWYRSSETDFTWLDSGGYMTDRVPWKSPLFMPRRLSRLTLEITEVRVERLQAITEADAQAEGFRPWTHRTEGVYTALWQFRETWERLNAKRGFSWDLNPWVWAIAFRRLEVS